MVEELLSKKIGLFFGSFNPIHLGHLIIGNYFVENTDLDEIWFVVSPQNPLKSSDSLLDDKIRLELVSKSIVGNKKFKASDVEFTLEKPSYTINTLNHLKETHPDKEFVLIIGEDNLEIFDKWKSYEDILNNFKVYVYPRPNVSTKKFKDRKNVFFIEAPLIEISSTYIRESIMNKKSIMYLTPEIVRIEIENNKYFSKV